MEKPSPKAHLGEGPTAQRVFLQRPDLHVSEVRMLREIQELKSILEVGVRSINTRIQNLEKVVIDQGKEWRKSRLEVLSETADLKRRVTKLEKRASG